MLRYGLLTAIAILFSLSVFAQSTTYNERAVAYVAQYKTMAMEEQRRSGIPAAITLGQGILETEAGASELATIANNHFGIKCRKGWAGETFAHDDDAIQECFCKYTNAVQSYKDHSDYLRKSKRYASCFVLDQNDYAAWARELRKCGYATNPKYAQILTKIIEDFHLQDYTYAAAQSPESHMLLASADAPAAAAMMAEDKKSAPGEVVPEHDTPSAPEYGRLMKKDGARGFWARKGDVLLEYAIQYKVRYAKILEINGLPDAPLASDQFVYIEKGGKVDAMLAKDFSEPAPAAVSTVSAAIEEPHVAAPATTPAATQPAAATSVASKNEEQPAAAPKVETPATVASSVQPEPAGASASSGTAEVTPATIVKETSDSSKPAAAEQPMDEFAKLKARLDKAVYAPAKPRQQQAPLQTPVVAKPAVKPITKQVVVASSAGARRFHTVATGETMFGIAKRYGITMKELMALNGLQHFEAVKTGQKLRVK